jgi:hypothetical protein
MNEVERQDERSWRQDDEEYCRETRWQTAKQGETWKGEGGREGRETAISRM